MHDACNTSPNESMRGKQQWGWHYEKWKTKNKDLSRLYKRSASSRFRLGRFFRGRRSLFNSSADRSGMFLRISISFSGNGNTERYTRGCASLHRLTDGRSTCSTMVGLFFLHRRQNMRPVLNGGVEVQRLSPGAQRQPLLGHFSRSIPQTRSGGWWWPICVATGGPLLPGTMKTQGVPLRRLISVTMVFRSASSGAKHSMTRLAAKRDKVCPTTCGIVLAPAKPTTM